MKQFIVLSALLFFFYNTQAAGGGCGTTAPANYIHTLSEAERSGDVQGTSARSGIRWVPVWYHFITKDDGTGIASLKNVLITHCELNNYYNQFNIGFWIQGIDTVKNTTLWLYQTMQNYDAFPLYNEPNTCNIYINGNLPGLCGVSTFPSYSPSGGGIFLNKDCVGAGTTTLPHEMGHYFNLLHTFETAFGAELVTRGSGKNCTHAGDGFCDTPADPSSNRASCPYTGTTTDAQGQLYTPDVTLFMSYFDDNCTNRFSTEEQSEMNTTLSSSRSYLLNQTSPDLSALDSAVFINPVAGDSTIIGGTLTNFVWHAIPRAKFYYFHLQSSTSSIVFADTLITDTTFAVQLAANKGYKYWVKGMSYGNTCGENAFYQTIKTSVIKATVTIVTPSCQGQTNGTIAVAPSNGVYPYKYQWSNGDTTQTISNLTPGVYYLTITDNAGQVATTSVIVTEPSLLSATINQIGINLNAYGNGGTPPYTYSWSNGANGQYNNNVPFGNYTVTVTDSKGCTVTESIVYSTIGEDNTSKVAMKIFPNPASASTAIQLQIDLNERTEGTVTMFNINGEILQQAKREFIIGANHLSLNIEPLAAGVYFVQFRSNNAVKTERISILK